MEEYKCKGITPTFHPFPSSSPYHIKALHRLEQLLNRQLGVRQKSDVVLKDKTCEMTFVYIISIHIATLSISFMLSVWKCIQFSFEDVEE